MTATARILVVEDEEAMAAGLEYGLRREGFDVLIARDGESALGMLRDKSVDLVLLDLMLPRKSGYDVLKALRADGRGMPVILLTAMSQEMEKVQGFELGADDYVTKPFGFAELLARMRARLRRITERESIPDLLQLGTARIDLKSMSVELAGKSEILTLKEVEMLKLLWSERGKPVSRKLFLDRVWGMERFPSTRTVDQHVAKLRQKIEQDPANPRHLLTVFGVGYRLDP